MGNPKHILILVLFLLLLGVGIISFKYIFRENNKTIPGATWEIILNYDTSSNNLTLKKTTLVEKIISEAYGADSSEYSLKVVSDTGSVLHENKIDIDTKLDYNVLAYPVGSNSASFGVPKQPKNLETLLFVPYSNDAKSILILKHGKEILKINPPRGNFRVEKAGVSASCNPLTTVFISDGYTDFNQFDRDAEALKQVFLNVEPFKSKTPSIFEFEKLANTVSLGCVESFISCSKNTTKVKQLVAAVYPNAKKIIVLVNRPITTAADGSVGGINTPSVSFFANASDGKGTYMIPPIAVHEFLGHGVSGLDERYVNTGIGAGAGGPNCSTTSAGKSFWAQAGVTQTYQGCAYENYYAPGPLNCPAPNNPELFSAGTTTSAMSAAGCGGVQFDTAEQYWIKNYILPKYSACLAEVSPTTTESCDPYSEGSSQGIINIQDILLIRSEVAKITEGNKGSCITDPVDGATTISDLLKGRRMAAGLE